MDKGRSRCGSYAGGLDGPIWAHDAVESKRRRNPIESVCERGRFSFSFHVLWPWLCCFVFSCIDDDDECLAIFGFLLAIRVGPQQLDVFVLGG